MSEIVEQFREKIHKELDAANVGGSTENSEAMNLHFRIKTDLVNAIEDSISHNDVFANEDICAELLKLDNVLDRAYALWETKKNFYPLDEAAAKSVQLLSEEVK